MQDARCKMQDARCKITISKMQDSHIQAARCKVNHIQDARCKITISKLQGKPYPRCKMQGKPYPKKQAKTISKDAR
jgi:hypothetical protein